jgi:hypothetical protein
VLENPAVPAVRVALAVPENPVVPAVRVALAALENPAVPAVRVVLAVPENPAALAVLENPEVQVALAVLENLAVPAALARQQAAAPVRQVVAVLLRQVGVVQKEAQIRSVAISPRAAAAAAPSLAGVGALLKPRAIEVAVA